ncbi:HesA/MoeB/ThiF family protein [Pelagibacterium mangrovi]|uniref:HesA/MoeB/ThiF family protein n=1 Tax=Pelagibacterium mangrovi TaxID=3119828 RepID=UPI002FC9265A
MALTSAQSARYARHIVLKDMGGVGQQKLAAAHVAVVGAGGLGAPVIAYLAGAGIGTLTIIDPDTVSLSNLARQVIYTDADLDHSKAVAAARFGAALNPEITVDPVVARLDADNAESFLSNADLVIEGTDFFATKRLVAAVCGKREIPLVTGALGPFDGSVTTLAPFLDREDGTPWPAFDALYPVDPTPEDSPPCELVGVLNVLPGIIGTMMANEAIKWLAGFGEPLLGKLLLYSARTGESRIMRYR